MDKQNDSNANYLVVKYMCEDNDCEQGVLINNSELLELVDYRNNFYKRAKRFLRLCLSINNWIHKQLSEARDLLDDAILTKFNKHFEDLSLLIDDVLDEFEIYNPKQNDPYNFEEHDAENDIDDSGDLCIETVVEAGYRLDGNIIRKARVVLKKTNSEREDFE